MIWRKPCYQAVGFSISKIQTEPLLVLLLAVVTFISLTNISVGENAGQDIALGMRGTICAVNFLNLSLHQNHR